MPISFLNPTLLFGALAAALPVIIHFLSRRRVQRRRFSDLRFLDEVQARQARSLGLRRWLLLLLRVLAILCIAFAAAGPRWGGLGTGSGAQSVLFIIDTSASMGTGQEVGTRLDEAVRACADMMRALPGDTAVQVLVAGSRTRPVFGDWLPAGAGALAGLDLVVQTDGPFDLARVFTEAARLVARAPGSPVQVVLLSDLQEAPPGGAWQAAAARLRDAGPTNLLVRQVGAEVAGGGVVAVALPSRAVRPGENIAITARVIPQYADQVFALDLDGRPVAEVVTGAAVGTPVDIVFPVTVPGTGRHLGAVRKETDALAADDNRPFVLEVPQTLQVLLVHGTDQPQDGAAGRGAWRYLAEALAPGGDASAYKLHISSGGDLTTGDISAADVAFFVDTDPLGRRALEGLQEWVRGGGQAVFLVGDPKLAAYLGETLWPAIGLPPTAVFTAVGGPGQRSRIIDPAHPVFAGLDAASLATFQDVPWRRWFRLEEGDGRVLVTLSGDDPLVVEVPFGEGRFVVLPFDLQPVGSDFAGSPMALPFFQRLAGWLAGSGGDEVNTEVGRPAVFTPRGAAAQAVLDRADDLLVRDSTGQPAGAPTIVWEQGQPSLLGGPIDQAGFVTFLAGGDTVGVLAAGTPAAESTPRLGSVRQLDDLLAAVDLRTAADLTDASADGLAAALGGRDLAPWLLALALALLVVELGLGRGAGA